MLVVVTGVPMFSEKITTGPAELMVRVSAALASPAALVAFSETSNVPEAVGVPEIRPVVVFVDKPAGNPVAAYEVGEWVAVI